MYFSFWLPISNIVESGSTIMLVILNEINFWISWETTKLLVKLSYLAKPICIVNCSLIEMGIDSIIFCSLSALILTSNSHMSSKKFWTLCLILYPTFLRVIKLSNFWMLFLHKWMGLLMKYPCFLIKIQNRNQNFSHIWC